MPRSGFTQLKKLYDSAGAQYNSLLLDPNVQTDVFTVNGILIPRELVVGTIKEARKREVNRLSAKSVRMKAKNIKKLTTHQTAMIVHCLKKSTSLLQQEMCELTHMIRREIGTYDGTKTCLTDILACCEGIRSKLPTSNLIEQLCIHIPLDTLSLE